MFLLKPKFKNGIISALCSKCERNLMEVELKYAVPDEKTAEWIWSDEELGAMAEEGSWSVDRFRGLYYDTADRILTENDIAFRIRREGEKTVATLKWRGSREGALYKREELNVTVEGGVPEKAEPDIFSQSEMGKKVIELTQGSILTPLIEVDVLRKQVRVDTGKSLLEISIDLGKIHTRNGDADISEIEIELFQGDEEDLMQMGSWLAEKYGLVVEEKSKFARGLEKLGLEKDKC